MPYLPYLDEEQKKKAEQNGQINLSGSSNTINQAAQSVAPSAPKPVGRSGSWTNLDTYLNANKDNAETMGNTVASNISNAGSAVRTGLQNTQTDYNTLVDQGTIKNLDTAKLDSDNIVKQARTANQDNQINDDQVNRFKDISNATYAGPNTLNASQYYADTKSKLSKAKDYQNNAQSDEGRFNLLQEMYNRPSYSQGQKSFDNLLIQGNQQAKTNIKGAADSLSDLQSSWGQANTEAATVAAQRLAATNDARQFAQNSLSANRNKRSSEVDTSLADINSKWADEYNQYKKILSNYSGGDLELTKDQAEKLGVLQQLAPSTTTTTTMSQKMTPNVQGPIYAQTKLFNALKNTPASSYLDLQAFNANKVIDKDQFAQLSALDKLANQYGLASSSKFKADSQAGTLGLHNNFDASRFGVEATKQQNDFNNYAQTADFSSDGENTQSWNYGPGGTLKDSLTRKAHLNANLANVLKQGGYNTDTTSGLYTNDSLIGAPLNDLLTKGFGSVVDGGGDLWRDGSSEAARAASETAFNQARGGLFSQLQAALDNQGFSNRIKIKG